MDSICCEPRRIQLSRHYRRRTYLRPKEVGTHRGWHTRRLYHSCLQRQGICDGDNRHVCSKVAQMGQLWYQPLEERRLDTLDKRYLRLSQGTADILRPYSTIAIQGLVYHQPRMGTSDILGPRLYMAEWRQGRIHDLLLYAKPCRREIRPHVL